MKFSDIKIGEEYAIGNATRVYEARTRVRVLEAAPEPSAGFSAITDARRAEIAKNNLDANLFNRIKVTTIAVDGVDVPVSHVRRSYSSREAKGFAVLVLDRTTGEPERLDDGTPLVRFIPSRSFLTDWAQLLIDEAAAKRYREEAQRARKEKESAQITQREAVLVRLFALGYTPTSIPEGDLGKIDGMFVSKWEALLAAVDAKIVEASK